MRFVLMGVAAATAAAAGGLVYVKQTGGETNIRNAERPRPQRPRIVTSSESGGSGGSQSGAARTAAGAAPSDKE